MDEFELTFWEKARVLEARLDESRKRFWVSAQNFLSCPSLNYDGMISAARDVQKADRERFTHAGAARCTP